MIITKTRFLPLLIVLLLVLLTAPFFMESPFRNWIFNITFTVALLVAVVSLKKHSVHYYLLLSFAIISIFFHSLYLYFDTYHLLIIDSFTGLLFIGMLIFMIFYALFEGHRITTDSIFAAISIYLLIGILFGVIYGLIEIFIPGSFILHDQTFLSQSIESRFQLILFSYSNITTVGHSQVLAVKPFAETVVALEQILGVFYLGILIARLVTGLSVIYKERL